MKKLKRVLRFIILGILILMALVGIPIGIGGGFLRNREMDVDNEVKTEIVEGTDQSDKT
jgi:hypothetical protein